MIIFNFFIIFIKSFTTEPGEIIHLTINNWDQYIDKRNLDSVWLIMIYSDHCPACKALYPIFEKASQQSDGMINFGKLNDGTDNMISMRFGIKYLPTFLIIHKEGRIEYTGKKTDRAMINAAAKYIPDKTKKVNSNWLTDEIESVILFTDKKQTPPMWSAVSCISSGKLRVGITDDLNLKELFQIEKIPSILFLNKTHKIIYNNKLSFISLMNSIKEFSEGIYEEPFEFNNDFYLPEEYFIETEKFTGYCIIHVISDLNPILKNIRLKFNNNRLKFFYGEDDLPYKFMKLNDIWIFAPKRKMAIKINNLNELEKNIEKIFDSNINWLPIDSFIE